MMHYKSVIERCRNAQEIFQNKQFLDWKGLPPTCRMSELMQVWQSADDGVMQGRLGSRRVPTSYRYCSVQNHSVPVRVWHIRGRPVQIDVEDFTSEIIDNVLLTQLGAPEAKLDANFGFMLLREGEWFFGKRGMSLLYSEEEKRVVSLAVFVPMGLDQYVEDLRIDHATESMLRTY